MRWWFYYVAQVVLIALVEIIRFINWISRGRLFFGVSVVGKERLGELSGPLIVTPNHKSFLDHPLVLTIMAMSARRSWDLMPMRVMGAQWLFDIRFLGIPVTRKFFRVLGGTPFQRGHGLDVALAEPMRYLCEGQVVFVYPEGGIRFRPGIYEMRNGAGYLAMRSGVPVLPVALRGLEYLSPKTFLFGRRTFVFVFGVPFKLQGDLTLAEATAVIKKKIEGLYLGTEAA